MVEASLSKLGHGASPRIAFESGRYLTGSCGRLLCTVQDVKYSRGERHVVLDAGINHLGGMQGLRRLGSAQIEVLLIDHIGEQSKEEYADITHVVGPLCTPLDRWACLPGLAKLKPGDLVEVRNVGAYGLSASLLAFLSRDTPCEVVIDNEAVVAATRLSISSEHVLPRRLLAGYAPPKTG
jgi:diaminopimelate decarboxylase